MTDIDQGTHLADSRGRVTVTQTVTEVESPGIQQTPGAGATGDIVDSGGRVGCKPAAGTSSCRGPTGTGTRDGCSPAAGKRSCATMAPNICFRYTGKRLNAAAAAAANRAPS